MVWGLQLGSRDEAVNLDSLGVDCSEWVQETSLGRELSYRWPVRIHWRELEVVLSQSIVKAPTEVAQ